MSKTTPSSTPGISAVDIDRPLSYQANPNIAFQSLFGIAATGKDAAAEQKVQALLLDHMVDDIKRFQDAIGNEDREKLDHYLGAFEGPAGSQSTLERHGSEDSKTYPPNLR